MSDMKIPLERTGGRQVLPDGAYRVRVEKLEQKTGPSGSPYLNLTLRVLQSNGKPSDTLVWEILSFAPRARFKIDQVLDALGAPTEGSWTPRQLINKTMWVNLTSEVYQGTTKNVVESYINPEEAENHTNGMENDYVPLEEPAAEGDLPTDITDEEDIPF